MRKIKITDLELLGPNNQDLGIRFLRHPALLAYDVYRISVLYGDLVETEEEHAEMLAWAQRARDKDRTALENIPDKIKHFMQE